MKNKGQLGLILMHAMNLTYQEVQEYLDYIEVYCKKHGYNITVEKLDKP